jgi:hypothetical protein
MFQIGLVSGYHFPVVVDPVCFPGYPFLAFPSLDYFHPYYRFLAELAREKR